MASLSQIELDGTTYDLKDAVARSVAGSPLVATTAAAMTDTTKIYVYVGTESGYNYGDWYYYTGSAWADGGSFGATDTYHSPLTDVYVNAVAQEQRGSSGNLRTCFFRRNVFGTIGDASKTGTTFQTYLLTDNFRYVHTTIDNAIANMTAADFKGIIIPSDYALWMRMSVIATRLRNQSSTGLVHIATRNPSTGSITYNSYGGIGLTQNQEKSQTMETNVTAALPELITNKNIAVLYTSKYPSTSETFAINLETRWSRFSTANYNGTIAKTLAYEEVTTTATKAHSVNDIILIGNNIYKVTAAIANGGTITPGTNVQYTTLGDLITGILNS